MYENVKISNREKKTWKIEGLQNGVSIMGGKRKIWNESDKQKERKINQTKKKIQHTAENEAVMYLLNKCNRVTCNNYYDWDAGNTERIAILVFIKMFAHSWLKAAAVAAIQLSS